MATTIFNSFADFKKNLEISNIQSEIVSTRQKNVRISMESEFLVQSSFLTGSYMRSTMIAPLNQADIDIFIVLDPKYFHNYNGQNGGQRGLLDLVKRTLKRTYPSTPDISRDGQAVTIRFSDFIVDVVPGFERLGGGYLIPNAISQNWISTDPKKHVEILSVENKNNNNYLVPIIKMLKAWNRKNNKYFNSFHIEVIAIEVFHNVIISDYPSGIRYFFQKGKDLINKVNLDPAGYGGDIGAYINSQEKVNEAVSKFETAYESALKAESLGAKGFIRESIEIWIKIFGNYFPSYG